MKREIAELREVVRKLVPLLTGKGLQVTQRGSKAFVQTDPATLKPIRVNIPNIGDNASDSFIRAVQGFIDHEVAHVLITDWRFYGGGPTAEELKRPDVQKLMNCHNIIEDTMIEREIVKIFPGSQKNIADLREHFIRKITKPALEKAKSPEEAFNYLLVPTMRALAGHREFEEFMEDGKHWEHPMIKKLVEAFDPQTLERLKTVETTEQTLVIAKELFDILYKKPPQPPAPPMSGACDEEADGESQDKPEQQAGAGDGDGERDHSEQDESDGETGPGETGEQEGEEDDGDQPGGDPEEADEKPDEDDDGAGSDQEAEEADEEADTDDDDGTGSDDDSGDDDGSDADDGSDTDGAGDEDAGEQDGDDEGEGDESPGADTGDDDDESDGDDDDGAGGRGDEDTDSGDEDDAGAGGSSDEADDDDESESTSGGASDPGLEQGDDEGEGSSSSDMSGLKSDGGTDTSETNDPSFNDDESQGGSGVGSEEAKSIFEFEEDALEGRDIAEEMMVMISEEAQESINQSDWSVFTREWDRVEPLEPPERINSKWIPEMEEEVRSMTGRMQKDIERIMASQSHVVNQPGHKKGRLHAASLYRVTQGDPRVFTQRQVHTSKDTAVTLLVDNSGSMSGVKMRAAMLSAYALSSTLDRVQISHEMIGFTTGSLYSSESMNRGIMEEYAKEMNERGVSYDRVIPLSMPIYKEFDERLDATVKKRVAYSMNAQRGLNGNIDGESLMVAAERLARRPEHRKVMLVLSDGQPAGGYRSGPHLKSTVKYLNENGIETIGIGIMSKAVERYYENHVVLNNVEDLPGQVMTEIKRLLA